MIFLSGWQKKIHSISLIRIPPSPRFDSIWILDYCIRILILIVLILLILILILIELRLAATSMPFHEFMRLNMPWGATYPVNPVGFWLLRAHLWWAVSPASQNALIGRAHAGGNVVDGPRTARRSFFHQFAAQYTIRSQIWVGYKRDFVWDILTGTGFTNRPKIKHQADEQGYASNYQMPHGDISHTPLPYHVMSFI